MDSFSLNVIGSVALLTFDAPRRKVNILDMEVLEELEGLLDQIEGMQSDIKGAVFLSGKERNFIAGADLAVIQGISDPEQGASLARTGQKIMDRIAGLAFTTVAAIHGSCLGGGLELALACDRRVASDAHETSMGLPETQLGIIPGFGGTQRLPRLVGLPEAIRMITTGRPVHPPQALKSGLVDEVTKREHLVDAAMAAVAGDLPDTGGGDWKSSRTVRRLQRTWPLRRIIIMKARKAVMENTRGHYPAPLAALDAIGHGLARGMAKGLVEESRLFGQLAVTEISRNLIRVFHLRESFAKGDPSPAADIRSIAVIGGGAMGAGIAALAAEKGIRVRLVDLSEKALGDAIRFLHEDVRKKQGRGRYSRVEAEWIPTRLSVDTRTRGFARADVVIEAVAERMDVKRSVFSSVAGEVSPQAIIATNTSSLPVAEMADAVREPGRVAGLHFFNPVGRMPLVEVVRAPKTSGLTVERLAAFARRLGKVPIVVSDSPGFLVNRLLLPYLNEGCYLLQEGAGVTAVDEALMDFGMPMGVFLLLDQVGIDIALHAGRSMLEGFGERMKPSPVLGAMVEDGRLGKKSGKGFYLWNGSEKDRADPAVKGLLAPHRKEGKAFNPDQLVRRLIYPMINEATLCLEEKVVEGPEAVDAAMILGAGFPPFTGGLLRYADAVGIPTVAQSLKELSSQVDSRFEPSRTLRLMAEEERRFYS